MQGKIVITTLSLVGVLILGACMAPSGGTMADTSSDTMAEGEMAEGEMAEGEMAEGEMAEGEMAEGEMAEGEMAEGEMAEGEMAEGEMAEGEMAEGEMAEGEMAEGEMMMKEVTFHVRIENLSGDASVPTPFSPGVWVLHSEPGLLFTAGEPNGGHGLEALSEDGNPADLAASLEAAGIVHGVFNTPDGATDPGPATPGSVYEFEITASPEMPYLSLASMFVQSNDLFIAPDEHGIDLFDEMGHPISGDVTDQILLWDAGVELNEEPGVGPNQAPRQTGADTGPEDEDDTVRLVNDEFNYPTVLETIRVTIEAAEMME